VGLDRSHKMRGHFLPSVRDNTLSRAPEGHTYATANSVPTSRHVRTSRQHVLWRCRGCCPNGNLVGWHRLCVTCFSLQGSGLLNRR